MSDYEARRKIEIENNKTRIANFNAFLKLLADQCNSEKLGGFEDWKAEGPSEGSWVMYGCLTSGIYQLCVHVEYKGDSDLTGNKYRISPSCSLIKSTPMENNYGFHYLRGEERPSEINVSASKTAMQIVNDIKRRLWDGYAEAIGKLVSAREAHLKEMSAREAFAKKMKDLGVLRYDYDAKNDPAITRFSLGSGLNSSVYGDLKVNSLTYGPAGSCSIELHSLTIEDALKIVKLIRDLSEGK